MTREHVVVAGIDGSTQALHAAHWAAGQAALRGAGLQLIHCYLEPIAGDGYLLAADVDEQLAAAAQQVLQDAAESVQGSYPDLLVLATLVHADPRPTLLAASASALLTVVGSKGRGRIADVVVGSVALTVASHAESPVAVIPSGGAAATNGPVLLGVCDTADSVVAVGFAFAAAAASGTEVQAVLVVDEHSTPAFVRGPARTGSEQDHREQAVLTGQLTGWAEKYPDVPVHTQVRHGRVAPQLLASGRDLPNPPGMVVVGSRGRGGLTGMLLGSTGHALIAHSLWPVVVVRPGGN